MKNMIARWLDSDVGFSFRSSPVAMVAAFLALSCLFCAFFAGWVAPHNPFDLATLELNDARINKVTLAKAGQAGEMVKLWWTQARETAQTLTARTAPQP